MSVTPVPSDNDDDYDIYGDLTDDFFSRKESPKKPTDAEYKSLKTKISQLVAEADELRKTNESLKSTNHNLSCNISILLNTAKEEIQRKDKTITDLRRELDNVVFRRKGKVPTVGFIHGFPSQNSAPEVDVRFLKSSLKQHLEGSHSSAHAESIVCEPEVYGVCSEKACERPMINSEQVSIVSSSESNRAEEHVKERRIQNCIKDVPKKRKIIEFSLQKQEKSTVSSEIKSNSLDQSDVSTDGYVGEEPKKRSVWERLGHSKFLLHKRTEVDYSEVSSEKIINCKRKTTPSGEESSSIPHFDQVKTSAKDSKSSCVSGVKLISHHANSSDLLEKSIELEEFKERRNSSSSLDSSVVKTPIYADAQSKISTANNDDMSIKGKEEETERTACESVNSSPIIASSYPSSKKETPGDVEGAESCVNSQLNSLNPSNGWTNPSIQSQEDSTEKAPIQLSEEIVQGTPLPPEEPEKKLDDSFGVIPIQSPRCTENLEALSSLSLPPDVAVGKSFVRQPQNKQLSLPPATCLDSYTGNEDSVACAPFQPPLPRDDPVPLPPLPLSTPPPTPLKKPPEPDAVVSEEESECKKVEAGAHKEVSMEECVNSTNLRQAETNVCGSDENLMMQCPFKPRRRAKSIVLLQEPAALNKHGSESPEADGKTKVSPPSTLTKPPDFKLKKTPLKKSDIHENRLASDFRPHQTQRSVYSSRHLSSVKSFAHMPERRSPSELLNGRSGRIERLSHEDKIRIRLRDRRSRSLSPQRRRGRQEDYRTRNYQTVSSSKEISRRILTDNHENKYGKNEDEKKVKSLRLKRKPPYQAEKEEHVTQHKSRMMADLFGESSPEPEDKISKAPNRTCKSDHESKMKPIEDHPPLTNSTSPSARKSTLSSLRNRANNSSYKTCNSRKTECASSTKECSKRNTSVILQRSEKKSPSAAEPVLKTEKLAPDDNRKNNDEEVIIVRRRPRSNVKLEPSENANSRTSIGINKPPSSYTPLTNGESDNSLKVDSEQLDFKEKQDKTKKQESALVKKLETTPLYFREGGFKRRFSDTSAQDADSIDESDESSVNGDSDDTYDPKKSSKKVSKRKPAKRKK